MKTDVGLFGELPDKKIHTWVIPISAGLVAAIRERADRVRSPETKHDTGGYQSLVLALEERLEGNTLEVDYLILGRIFRYAYTPSGGGWETDLQSILMHARRHFSRRTDG